MNSSVMVAIITVSGSIVVAAASFFLTKWNERMDDWRKRKIEHYTVLLSAISDIAVDKTNAQAHRRLAQSFNTIGLVAPQSVIEALLSFWDYIASSQASFSKERHDSLLTRVILAIRADIGVSPKDDVHTFAFRLLGAPPVALYDEKLRESMMRNTDDQLKTHNS